MNPQYILNRSRDIRKKDMFRIFLERTYLLIGCIAVGWITSYLLISKPLEGKSQIIAKTDQCPLTDFWIQEYEAKECILSTDIKITEIESDKDTKIPAFKNFWTENPYRAKKDFVIKPPASAFIKAKIRWKYRKEIANAHKKTGVSKNLIAAVIVQESNGDPKAVSPCGAQGLMQLMPATAKRFGCSDPFNTYQNVLAGSKYLAYLNKFFKGNKTKVIAAYNAGEGNVLKYKGIPPFKETQNYVPKVIRHEYELAMLGD